jgi:hypothetical protein
MPTTEGEATYVAAWTAKHPGELPADTPVWPAFFVLAAVLVAIGRGRSLLQATDPDPLA